MPHVLITGANRGLGLEFVRQYKEAGWDVVATARNRAPSWRRWTFVSKRSTCRTSMPSSGSAIASTGSTC